MHLLVYNAPFSKISGDTESFCIRVASLIADGAVTVGSVFFKINYKRHLEKMKKFQSRLNYLMKCSTTEDGKKLATDMDLIYQELKRRKHLNPKELGQWKSMESKINTWFLDEISITHEAMLRTHLPQLQILQDAGPISYYQTDDNAPEELRPNYALASEILMRHPERKLWSESDLMTLEGEPTSKELFFLSFEYLNHDDRVRLWPFNDAIITDETEQEQKGWFTELFELPLLTTFTGQELISIRQEVAPVSKEFRQAVDNWIQIADNAEEKRACINHFNEQIIPAAKELQKSAFS